MTERERLGDEAWVRSRVKHFAVCEAGCCHIRYEGDFRTVIEAADFTEQREAEIAKVQRQIDWLEHPAVCAIAEYRDEYEQARKEILSTLQAQLGELKRGWQHEGRCER